MSWDIPDLSYELLTYKYLTKIGTFTSQGVMANRKISNVAVAGRLRRSGSECIVFNVITVRGKYSVFWGSKDIRVVPNMEVAKFVHHDRYHYMMSGDIRGCDGLYDDILVEQDPWQYVTLQFLNDAVRGGNGVILLIDGVEFELVVAVTAFMNITGTGCYDQQGKKYSHVPIPAFYGVYNVELDRKAMVRSVQSSVLSEVVADTTSRISVLAKSVVTISSFIQEVAMFRYELVSMKLDDLQISIRDFDVDNLKCDEGVVPVPVRKKKRVGNSRNYHCYSYILQYHKFPMSFLDVRREVDSELFFIGNNGYRYAQKQFFVRRLRNGKEVVISNRYFFGSSLFYFRSSKAFWLPFIVPGLVGRKGGQIFSVLRIFYKEDKA